jgi:hypothetical protein
MPRRRVQLPHPNTEANGTIKSLGGNSAISPRLPSIQNQDLTRDPAKVWGLLRVELSLRKLEFGNLRDDTICPGIDIVFLYNCA